MNDDTIDVHCPPIGRRPIIRTGSGLLLPGYKGDPVGMKPDGSFMWDTQAEVVELPQSTRGNCDIGLWWLQNENTLRGGLCHLEFEDPVEDGAATGSLISRRCILTSAHVLYDNGRYVTRVHVSAGRQGLGGSDVRDPFGTHPANLVRVPEEWRLHRDPRYDFGVAVLDSDELFRRTNYYMGVAVHVWDPNTAFHYGNISGYPGTGEGIVVGNPYFSYGKFEVQPDMLSHRMTSYPGMSGGPYEMSSVIHTVIGVHRGGDCPNVGVRITEEKLRLIHQWIDLYG